MKVKVEYSAQLKETIGQASEDLDVADATTVQTLMGQIAQRAGDEISSFLFSEQGKLSGSILLFLNDEQVLWSQPAPLNDGDVLTIATPIAGGISAVRTRMGWTRATRWVTRSVTR